MMAFTHATGDDTDDALVPRSIVEADDAALLRAGFVHQQRRVQSHFAFDFASLSIEFIQLAGKPSRLAHLGAEQTPDAHGHVGQPARRVQSRGDGKTEILGSHCPQITPGDLRQGPDSRTRQSGAHAPQSLVHQDSVVEIQGHDISDGTQSHQIQPIDEFRGSQASPARRNRPPTVGRAPGLERSR